MRYHSKNLFFQAAVLLLPAFLKAYDISVSPNYSRAEINDRKVDISILHSCSNGEGYEGEAKLSLGSNSVTLPVGFSPEVDREAVFRDVASLLPVQPGKQTFTGEVNFTDEKGDAIRKSGTAEVNFCRWNTVKVESKCRNGRPVYEVSLDSVENYDPESENPVFYVRGQKAYGGIIIDRSEFAEDEKIHLHIEDRVWGASKDVDIPNSFSAEEPCPGKPVMRSDAADVNIILAAFPGDVGRKTLSLGFSSTGWSDQLLSRASLSTREVESPPSASFFTIGLAPAESLPVNSPYRALRDDIGLFQVQYPGGFTDITNYPSGGYAVIGYLLTDTTACSTNDLSYIASADQPVAFRYDFLPAAPPPPPAPGRPVHSPRSGSMEISGYIAGGATNRWVYSCNGTEDEDDDFSSWELVTQNTVRETRSVSRLGANLRAVRRTVTSFDGSQKVSDVLTVEQKLPWGWTPVREVTDPEGAALTNSWTYAVEGPGTYGKLISMTDANNVTVTYSYDSLGRLSSTTSPTPSGLRRIEYDYTPVDPRENASATVSPNTPRTVTEYIGPTLVSRTWTAILRDAARETVVTERAASQSSAYGDAANMRDEKTSYLVSSSLGRLAGLPLRRLSSSGILTAYSYDYGTLSAPSSTGFRTFTAGGGSFLRTTVLRSSSSAPNGVPYQSTLDISVSDAIGNEVYTETRVLTGADGASEPVTWKSSEYDDAGRLISTLSSDASRGEFTYGEHGPIRSRDASGTVTETTYDALGRAVRTVVRDGTGVAKVTTTSFDLAGRPLSTTLSSGSLCQTTTRAYDLAGREVFSSTPDGLETSTSYGRIEGTPFIYTETITRPSPDLSEAPEAWAATNRSVRYKCGIAAWNERNGLRKTTYCYGVNLDGTQWTETYSGSAGTDSPVWTMTVSDFLGGSSGCGGSGNRIASEFRPAFGGGALETRNTYDSFGRLSAVRVYAISENDTESLLSATGYRYDSLGNRTVTISDTDGDGLFSVENRDNARSSETRFVKLGDDWFRESSTYAFPNVGSSERVLMARTRTRLTGLGSQSPYGVLQSETRSLALPSALETVTRSYVNRESSTSLTVTESPTSVQPAVSYMVGGLLVSNISSTAVATSYAYDELGRMLSVTDGRGNTSTRAYDAFGRVVRATDATGATTSYGHDPLGRVVSVADSLGNTTYSVYDTEGRLLSTSGASYPVKYTYDEFGRMTTLTTFRDERDAERMEGGDTTTWRYDESTGLLTDKIYADGNGTSYRYTPDGKLAARTWARGIETRYAYDFAGNLTNTAYSTGAPAMSFAYDRPGRQISAVVEGVSTNLYSYSVYGQLTNEVQNGVTVERAYDMHGRPAGYGIRGELASGENLRLRTVEYAYDDLGRFLSVTSGTNHFTYSYLPGSGLVSGYTSGAFVRTVAYERQRNLVASVENRFGATLVSAFGYANDAAGRRTAITRSGEAFSSLSSVADAYGYDRRSQVVSARRTLGGAEVRGFDYDYEYDPIGNRRTSSIYDELGEAHVSSYAANALNQYTSRTVPGNVQVHGEADASAVVTVNENETWRSGEYFYGGDYADNTQSATNREVEIVAVIPAGMPDGEDEISSVTGRVFVAKTPEHFTYDGDGNMTGDGRFRYFWNEENRMVCASNAEVVVTYAYDHRGRMIRKNISRGGAEMRSISYTWDNWNIIRETQTTGRSLQTTYNVWGLDLDGTMQGAGGVGGLLAVVREDGTYLPAYDANGNISEYIFAVDGSIAAHRDYSPFGEPVISVGDTSSFSHWFSTKPWCADTKLLEYQFRKYYPEIGRWMSRDPIGEECGYNLLGFVSNSPLCAIDLFGQFAIKDVLNNVTDALLGLGDKLKYVDDIAMFGIKAITNQPEIPIKGDVLDLVVSDPGMEEFRKKLYQIIIDRIEWYAGSGMLYEQLEDRIVFSDYVGFGGNRAPENMVDQLKDPFNPKYAATWKVAFNPLTWMVRNVYVSASADIDIYITCSWYIADSSDEYSFTDTLDLRPRSHGNNDFSVLKNPSENPYDAVTVPLGTLYHDVLKRSDKIKVEAKWKESSVFIGITQ